MAKEKLRGPGQPSTKTDGHVITSLRVLAQEQKYLRYAAKLERRSFNSWAVKTLITEARKIIREHKKLNGQTSS